MSVSSERWPVHLTIEKVQADPRADSVPTEIFLVSGLMDDQQAETLGERMPRGATTSLALGSARAAFFAALTREQLADAQSCFEPVARSWRGRYHSVTNAFMAACAAVLWAESAPFSPPASEEPANGLASGASDTEPPPRDDHEYPAGEAERGDADDALELAQELVDEKEQLSLGSRSVIRREGRLMSRREVLEWRERWSLSDIRTIEAAIDHVQASRFSLVPSRAYIRCLDDQNRILIAIFPGYLHLPRGHRPPGLHVTKWKEVALSTFRNRSQGVKPHDEVAKYCATHGYPITPSGGCDACSSD